MFCKMATVYIVKNIDNIFSKFKSYLRTAGPILGLLIYSFECILNQLPEIWLQNFDSLRSFFYIYFHDNSYVHNSQQQLNFTIVD